MKRQLILLRHAKSDWGNESMPDFDRPLRRDRRSDVPLVANHFLKYGQPIEMVMCSTAKRTRETCLAFINQIQFPPTEVAYEDSLYLCSADQLLNSVGNIPSVIHSLLVVAHNPALGVLATFLTQGTVTEMPTTSLLWLEFEKENWNVQYNTNIQLRMFITPKMLKLL